MLYYKAWRESQDRFLYTLAGMVLLCGLFVLSYPSWHLDPARVNFSGFIWHALYFRFFHAAWVFSTLFLALGGVAAERHEGTALFTLSPPARGWRMVLVRAAVGAAEAVAGAILPAITISAFAPLVGSRYPVVQSLEFALLLAAGGLVFLALGILLSAFLGGGWPPLAAGVSIIGAIYTGTRASDSLRAFNPQDLFTGAATVQPPAWALGSPLPWSAVAASLLAALVLVVISIVVTEKQQF